MNPDVLLMTALAVMWAALVGLLWIVWRLCRRVVELEVWQMHQQLAELDTIDDATWAAVTDAFRDTHTDMEVTPL